MVDMKSLGVRNRMGVILWVCKSCGGGGGGGGEEKETKKAR
jgi:ribosomal protein L37AE/L43A